MKEVVLTKGKVALVDDEDFERVSLHKWSASLSHSNRVWYVLSRFRIDGKYKTVKLHRFILGLTDPKVECDHINHDGLDNRRCNLRVCDRLANNTHTRSRVNSSSVYLGVHWCNTHKRWMAQIQHKGVKYMLGAFKDEKAAALARDDFAVRLHGEYANLNFPREES